MDSKIYCPKQAVFDCSIRVKQFFPNYNGRFLRRTYAKPISILVEEMPAWEVKKVLDHREHHGKAQFLVK